MNSLLWRKIVGSAVIAALILPMSVSAAGIGS